jgi:NAD-dependent dihydropyrimidine dehydrogenase PreA subunit
MKAKILIFLALILSLGVLLAGRPLPYQITQNQCWVCGRCLYACPVHAIYYDDALQTFQIDQTLCNGDGLCVNSCPHGAIHQVVSNQDETALPAKLELSCYPNPMKEMSEVKYRFPVGNRGKIEIYNIKGQLIRTYGNLLPEKDEFHWDGKDKQGKKIPSGIYCFKLIVGSTSTETKITKVR